MRAIKYIKKTALDELAWWLKVYHPNYTVNDVRPSDVKGYLETTKPCTCTYPPFDGYIIGFPAGYEQGHYHTLDIGWYPKWAGKGWGRGPYAFWRAVVREKRR